MGLFFLWDERYYMYYFHYGLVCTGVYLTLYIYVCDTLYVLFYFVALIIIYFVVWEGVCCFDIW